jgi:prephenate dehydrogenase
MKTVVIGVGLIGGSMAKDLRSAGIATSIVGVDANAEHGKRAIELGIVDAIAPLEDSLRGAELVIITIPVNAIQKILPIVLDLIASNTIVMDGGSTKAQICKVIETHPKRKQFVAAHPIAGTENSGPTAAFNGLFKNKMNIICEPEKSSERALAVAGDVFNALGMNVTFMEPEEHDKHVAYVSHLSHVSSFLLGQTVLDIEGDEKNIFTLAGSGFASTVRLAKSSPEMWAPIFQQNARHLKKALAEYILHLQKFQQYLVDDEVDKLFDTMKQANEIKRVLQGIELKDQHTKTETIAN